MIARLPLLIVVCTLLFGALRTAAARPHGDPRREEAAARQQAAQGLHELDAGHLPQAVAHLEQAYARAPLPELLYHLGRIADQQHDEVAAADLYRRYLGTLPDAALPELRRRLAELMARVRDKASELDVSSADLGALLSLDRRLLGTLPLSAPLLIAAGPHRFQLTKGAQQFETNVLSLPAGQHLQLQLGLASRYAVLTLSSGIALLVEPADAPAEIVTQLERAVSTTAPSTSCFLIERERTLQAAARITSPDARPCGQRLECQEQLAAALDASFVLVLSLDPGSAPTRLTGRLYDAATGMAAGTAELPLPSIAPEVLSPLAAKLITEILGVATNRGRGTLQVSSEPSGARLVIAGRTLGRTPYSREAFEGPLELTLELDGYQPHHATLQIQRGEPTVVSATLQPLPEAAEPAPAPLLVPPPVAPVAPPPRRPRWRLYTGGAAIVAGVVVGGLGVSALAVAGGCIDPVVSPAQLCDYTYGTRTVGGALLGVGLAFTVGGVLLMAWPPR